MDLLIFVIALSVLVLVHEWGHFIAARKTGVKVEEFGLGLPPRMIGKKIKGTIYSLNWLPLGGFCKLYGEDGGAKGGNAFNNKKPWQKMIIVLGGVIMNFILAIVVFSVVYTVLGVPKEIDKVKILEVAENSPAYEVGLKSGDQIVKIEGREISKVEELTEEIGKYKGEEILLTLENGETFEVEARENPPEGEGSIGIVISNIEMVKVPWYRFYEGIGAGFKEAFYWGEIIINGIGTLVKGIFSGNPPSDMAGPVGMYQATSSINESQGIWAVIHFFAIISVNLAIVNILPFPALDGGRIIFVFYEMITRKKVNQKFEARVNSIGIMILLALIALVTISDISRLFFK